MMCLSMFGIFVNIVVMSLYRKKEVRARVGRLTASPASPAKNSPSIIDGSINRKCGSGNQTVPTLQQPRSSLKSNNFRAPIK